MLDIDRELYQLATEADKEGQQTNFFIEDELRKLDKQKSRLKIKKWSKND